MQERLREKVRTVVDLLAAGQYAQLEKLTSRKRLTAEEIAQAVTTYGRTLIQLPDDAYNDGDVVKVNRATPSEWSVWIPLWTSEEGRSDLTLQLTLRESTGDLEIELDDIHVL